MPKISVIVPVYKVEQYIHECVDSILAQTFSDFELILVDDGSPDNCGAICDEYAAKDCRVRVIHQENQGVSAARNAALDAAKGEFVAFIDSDDVIDPHYLEILFNAMGDDIDIVNCMSKWFEDGNEVICANTEEPYNIEVFDAKEALIGLYNRKRGFTAATWARLYRTEMIQTIRFPVGIIHEDTLYTPMTYYKARKIALCNVALYHYRLRENSIVHSRFTLNHYDEIWALDTCINFFEEQGETEIAKAARASRQRQLCVHAIMAKRDRVEIPKQYQVSIPWALWHIKRLLLKRVFTIFLDR